MNKPAKPLSVEDGTEKLANRIWIASYTASGKHRSVLCRGLHFRSIHDSKEDAERMPHDPQAEDFTVTEYVRAEEMTHGCRKLCSCTAGEKPHCHYCKAGMESK